MTIEIELTKDAVAIVDDCDADLDDFSWYLHDAHNSHHYAARGGGKTPQLFMHRVILERKLERPLTDDERCEIVNNNGLDCRRANILLSVDGLYQRMTKRRSNNKTGYTGVTYHKREGRYRAQISVHGKPIHLGWRNTAEEASILYEDAKAKL